MGSVINWDKKLLFLIEIDGVARAAFQTCSEIGGEAVNDEYREGGRRHPHNSPGTVTFTEATLTRGACDDFDLYNWFRDCYDAASATGMCPPDLFRTLDIVQLDYDFSEKKRYRLFKAYNRKWSADGWDNDADDNLIETVIIKYDYFELVPA